MYFAAGVYLTLVPNYSYNQLFSDMINFLKKKSINRYEIPRKGGGGEV